jgi:hypothetical protein
MAGSSNNLDNVNEPSLAASSELPSIEERKKLLAKMRAGELFYRL